MTAGQNGSSNGGGRPLWVAGLSPPDSWRSLRQPGYIKSDTPNTASGGTNPSEVSIFDWRICFRWTDDGPRDVEIVDYH